MPDILCASGHSLLPMVHFQKIFNNCTKHTHGKDYGFSSNHKLQQQVDNPVPKCYLWSAFLEYFWGQKLQFRSPEKHSEREICVEHLLGSDLRAVGEGMKRNSGETN